MYRVYWLHVQSVQAACTERKGCMYRVHRLHVQSAQAACTECTGCMYRAYRLACTGVKTDIDRHVQSVQAGMYGMYTLPYKKRTDWHVPMCGILACAKCTDGHVQSIQYGMYEVFRLASTECADWYARSVQTSAHILRTQAGVECAPVRVRVPFGMYNVYRL